MLVPIDEIEKALKVLNLPTFITREDIKQQYYFLAKKYHPDFGGSPEMMEQISSAYTLLMSYIAEFRYTFDEEEISRQFPGASHAQRFRP